ncbi:MAG: hypothetical protein ACHQU1_10080 [Gemmatimonadales bacterium]
MVIGALYVAGATFEAGELRGAHVSIRDVLPNLPLQQLLARGVAAAGSAFLVWVALIPLLAVIYAMTTIMESRFDRTVAQAEKKRVARQRERAEIESHLRVARASGDTAAEKLEQDRLDELATQEGKHLNRAMWKFVLAGLGLVALIAAGMLVLQPIIAASVIVGWFVVLGLRGRVSRPVRCC